MPRLPDLTHRVREHELMDDPALDPSEHRRALKGLSRLNHLGSSAEILWRAIRGLVLVPGHPVVSVLDIATGSGDVPLALARKAARKGLHLSLHACDVSERALEEARARARQCHIPLDTFHLDATRQELPGQYDIVMCSLFTHHLDESDVVSLLYRMKAAARRMVLVNDLVRDTRSYLVAVAVSRLVSRSKVVHVDAERSMRAAFTIPEFATLADEAGLTSAHIAPRWPCRFLMTWSRQ